jgi:hypothetical protein
MVGSLPQAQDVRFPDLAIRPPGISIESIY